MYSFRVATTIYYAARMCANMQPKMDRQCAQITYTIISWYNTVGKPRSLLQRILHSY